MERKKEEKVKGDKNGKEGEEKERQRSMKKDD